MNQFLKYSGVLLILFGVIILGIYAYRSLVSNTLLIVSALLLIGGLAIHIILNKILD